MHNNLVAMPITILVVGFTIYRNTTWRTVTLAKLLRLPVIFALIGTCILVATSLSLGSGWHPSDVDFSVLGSEVVLAVVAGWAMGHLSQVRTVGGVVSSRLRPTGVAVFISFIAIRIVTALVADQHGGTAAIMSSSVLLIIAVIKFVEALVIRSAINNKSAAPVHETAEPVSGVMPQPNLR